MLSLIGATDLNGVIGFKGEMPWGRLPNDLTFFREKTRGHTVIMGRKTFDSIGKPLPDRDNIVVTSKEQLRYYRENLAYTNFHTARRIADIERITGEVFVIGGETIYEQFIPFADRVYRTVIEAEFEGDTYFPDLAQHGLWKPELLDIKDKDDKNPYKCYFYQFDKVKDY